FAASFRKRRFRSSLLRLCPRADDLLHQGLETRIAMEWVEQWIDFDPADIGTVAIFETLFEPAQRLLFVVQAEVEQSTPVGEHLAVLTNLIEIGQCLQGCTLVTSQSFSGTAKCQEIWIVAQFFCLLELRKSASKVALLLKNDTEPVLSVVERWIDLERLSQLRDGVVVATGDVQSYAQV